MVEVLGGAGRKVTLDEAQMHAFVQAVNGVRLVLGTVLDVTEDDEVTGPTSSSQPEYQLYAYLSWLLDSAVRAMSGAPVAIGASHRIPSGRGDSRQSGRSRPDRRRGRLEEGSLLVSRCFQLDAAPAPIV